ncbi:MAG: hypothetical protein AB1505_17955 [Candidatus Latescibacterota bacterium]
MAVPTRQGSRVYIEGVPRLTWASGEMSEFAAALRNVLQHRGDVVPYHFIMGTSGIAFRFVVRPQAWDPGNFPADDEQIMGLRYLSTAVNMTMIRDHGAIAPFLRQAAVETPELAAGLAPAIDCYSRLRPLTDRLACCMPDTFSPEAIPRVRDPAIRQEYAGIVLHMRDHMEAGIRSIEQFLGAA